MPASYHLWLGPRAVWLGCLMLWCPVSFRELLERPPALDPCSTPRPPCPSPGFSNSPRASVGLPLKPPGGLGRPGSPSHRGWFAVVPVGSLSCVLTQQCQEQRVTAEVLLADGVLTADLPGVSAGGVPGHLCQDHTRGRLVLRKQPSGPPLCWLPRVCASVPLSLRPSQPVHPSCGQIWVPGPPVWTGQRRGQGSERTGWPLPAAWPGAPSSSPD